MLKHALQISVKRCQKLPPEALKMQRPCSAALSAVFAIAYAVVGYIEIRGRFDSRSTGTAVQKTVDENVRLPRKVDGSPIGRKSSGNGVSNLMSSN
jgi:hypothetical protein